MPATDSHGLALPAEGAGTLSGVTLLPPDTVQQLLQDRRKIELVEPFKQALLKLTSQARRGGRGRRGRRGEQATTPPPTHPWWPCLPLGSQEAAKLMALAEYEAALPVALDAVRQGQALFVQQPAVEMFPLYLLAAQANLGLRRARQCEDFLSLASHLAVQEPQARTREA